MKRIVLGEGAYGCVHKPSIHCNRIPKPNFNYKQYVSKLMKTNYAEDELAEFVIIGNMDPTNEYHLGKPILCKPNLDEDIVKDDIKKCKYINLDNIESNPDKYSLLLLKYGGPDLRKFSKSYLVEYLKKDKELRVDKFWLEVHHLIKGLKFFKDNGIIHNDIKPQNILFDIITGKMTYIDFGLMRTKQAVVDTSEDNKNNLGIFHWSYPFDCGFMNKEQYFKYKSRSESLRNYYKNSLSEMIVFNSKSKPLNLSIKIKNPESFSILFTYLNPDNTVPNTEKQYGYIKSFFDGFNVMIERDSYNDNLNHFADSIDVFGLGFTLQFMANSFKHYNGLSLKDFTRLSTFFHKMYDFNPVNRVIDIDKLLNEYENILLEIGILTRLGKSFQDNNLVNKPPASTSNDTGVYFTPTRESKVEEKLRPQHLSEALEDFAYNDPLLKCPEGKELNHLTKRCVKKCKEGYLRNETFECRKRVKTIKHISTSKSGYKASARTRSRSRRRK